MAPGVVHMYHKKHVCFVDPTCHNSAAKNCGEERNTKADKHRGGQVDLSEDVFFKVDQLRIGKLRI